MIDHISDENFGGLHQDGGIEPDARVRVDNPRLRGFEVDARSAPQRFDGSCRHGNSDVVVASFAAERPLQSQVVARVTNADRPLLALTADAYGMAPPTIVRSSEKGARLAPRPSNAVSAPSRRARSTWSW